MRAIVAFCGDRHHGIPRPDHRTRGNQGRQSVGVDAQDGKIQPSVGDHRLNRTLPTVAKHDRDAIRVTHYVFIRQDQAAGRDDDAAATRSVGDAIRMQPRQGRSGRWLRGSLDPHDRALDALGRSLEGTLPT